MDKDWKTNKDEYDKSKVTYDKKKLNRLLKAFDSIFELQVGSYDFDYVEEYLNMTVVMETFHLNFFKQLLKKDKTVLPFVVLMKILDRLNTANINFEDPNDDLIGPTNLTLLAIELIEPFPHFYRKSRPETKRDIIKYFLNNLDLEKYNADVLFIITIIMSGILLDLTETEYFIPATDKLFKALSKFTNKDFTEDFNEIFSRIVANYIKNYVSIEYPIEKVLEKIDNVKHLEGAYGPIISFLTANDEVNIAYGYILSILDGGLDEINLNTLLDDEFSGGLQSFLYVSLCYDKMNYFKEIFPVFLRLPHDRTELKILLLLFEKCADPDDYNSYMESLENDKELPDRVKSEIEKFYEKHKTSSN